MNVFAIIAVAFASINIVTSYPVHASCKITWSFGINCTAVTTAINKQITTWKGDEGCKNGGEKCLYEKTGETGNVLKATHTTPVHHYKDDLTFTFIDQGSGCQVQGYSRSETWYAYLDDSTNYCNLHNLITGSGLNATAGYKESTSDSVCTQYSSADCEKY